MAHQKKEKKTLLDIVGGVLIFGSWIASNTLSQHANSQAAKYQRLEDRVHQFRVYDDFAIKTSAIKFEVEKTKRLVEQISNQLAPSETATYQASPIWSGMSAAHIRILNEFLEALEDFVEGESANHSLLTSISETNSRIDAMSDELAAEHLAFERLMEDLSDENVGAEDIPLELDDVRDRVNDLWQDYADIKKTMLKIGDDLVQIASEKAETTGGISKAFKRLSFILYAIGTCLIFVGQKLRGRKEEADA